MKKSGLVVSQNRREKLERIRESIKGDMDERFSGFYLNKSDWKLMNRVKIQFKQGIQETPQGAP